MVHKAEEEPKPVIHAAADSVRDGQIYKCQICRTHQIHLKHGRDDVLIPKIFEGEYLLCQGCYWCYRNCNAALVGTNVIIAASRKIGVHCLLFCLIPQATTNTKTRDFHMLGIDVG